MFSIYDAKGLIFNGTLEQINRVHAIDKPRSTRTIEKKSEGPGGETTANRAYEEAVRTYLSTLPRDLERGPVYHANQIMQRRVITVSDSDDVAHAWRTLRDNRIHQAPVLNEIAQLVGIVSERDLLTAINIDDGKVVDCLNRRVSDVMTTPVIAAAPVTDIRRIASVMIDHGVDGAPIVNDSGQLLGFISRGDVLRTVVSEPPLSLWR